MTTALRSKKQPARPSVRSAVVIAVHGGDDGTTLTLGEGSAGALGVARAARLAEIPGYRPTVGDRVIAVGEGDEETVIAVVKAARSPALALPDGSLAEVRDGALEVRDAAGRLLVRYADGSAEIAAPSRDLVLSAPHGKVVLDAATDVTITAARDLTHRAGRSAEVTAGAAGAASTLRLDPTTTRLKAPRLEVEAKSARLVAGKAIALVSSLATTAEHLAYNVVNYSLTANQIVEKARESLREASDVAETRLGRARTLVAGAYSLYTGRSVLVSKEDTSIDGNKILLG